MIGRELVYSTRYDANHLTLNVRRLYTWRLLFYILSKIRAFLVYLFAVIKSLNMEGAHIQCQMVSIIPWEDDVDWGARVGKLIADA